ncbi:hypothetical protein LY90DRAFT_665427, partial [Neocallimastix californiae]
MDKYKNNSFNKRLTSKTKKNTELKTTERYLMRGNINSNSNNNINNTSISLIDDSSKSRININNSLKKSDGIVNNNINKNNTKNEGGNSDNEKPELIKKSPSIESIGFIEMELSEAYNNPRLIQELNLNMTIPNLSLAILQAAINSTNGLTTLYHNSMTNNKNNNNKYSNNQCQCTIPDPSDLPIINHEKGILDINDPNGRNNNEDQPFLNEVDDLLQDLPDSSDMYKNIELQNDEIGFKDLKKLDSYISGLAKHLRMDNINDNFVTTNNEILSRYSNDNLNDSRILHKNSSKKDKILKTGNSKDSLFKLKRIYESKNIEFCKFPGYTANTVTPLPNNIFPRDVINKMLSNFKVKYQRKWKIILNYKENLDIICDIFWLSFISWYNPYHMKDFDAMHSRLSYSYVKFISKLHNTDKNEFLVNYPLIISHLNFLIYCECFPNSKENFECESFKKRDCELIYKWFVGDVPFEEVWLNWRSANSNYLIDTTEKKKKLTSQKKTCSNSYDVIYQVNPEMNNSIVNDVDNAIKKSRATNQTSSFYTTDLKIQKIHKNINNNSPIISHYIKNIGYDSSKLPYFIQSFEVKRVPKDPNKESLQQIIEDSMKRTNKNLRNYLKSKEEIIKEKNRGNQETLFYMRKYEKMTQKILTKPQQVKELCNIICEGLYSNKFTNGKNHLPKIKSGLNKQ